MLNEAIRRFLYPALVVTIVISVWMTGWSGQLQAEAQRCSYPTMTTSNGDDATTQPSDQSSDSNADQAQNSPAQTGTAQVSYDRD